MTVTVLSPHPDDAVLSAFGLLGPGVEVVTVFAGAPADPAPGPWDRICGLASSHAAMRARRAEDVEAVAATGATLVQLGLIEDQYAERSDLAAVLDGLAGAVGAGCTGLVAPATIGDHPDHVKVLRAAAAIAADRGIPLQLYADLPYAVRHGWPAELTGEDPSSAPDVLTAWSFSMPPTATAMQPVELSAVQRAAKRQAGRCYRSQWPALNGLGVLDADAFWRFEVRWSA